MKFETTGNSTSEAQISNVSPHGIWLLACGKEYFLPFEDYPWFQDAPIGKIFEVELLHGHHLHWPALDVDLELESLAVPTSYPLVYR
ncbi:DUF2442 domain-containing protein [Pelagicoccus enzymogenes]|uniref:DUF2442 domain-containing protein n=1 Tax=Pelagicoccus enzymogenes TaxID=2773457 RepID=UPI00280F6DA8|nr:DUF2442 domain-containing protein [Pelagicoccus enzymogenes]MDQ8201170.1 DUF2442 domain-containing protein [Pelagicoccus enzymogenes]